MSSPVDDLYWQDEVLQALYWLRGEGLADAVDAAYLSRILATESRTLGRQLARLAAGGYLERVSERPRRYHLTELGRLEGARSFADEFDGLTRSAHGECAPGCSCHDPERADEPCPNRPRPDTADAA